MHQIEFARGFVQNRIVENIASGLLTLDEQGRILIANRQAALTRLMAAQDAQSVFPRADLALMGPEGGADLAAEDLAQALGEGRRRDMAAGRTLQGPHRSDLRALYAAKGSGRNRVIVGRDAFVESFAGSSAGIGSALE